VPAAGAFQIAQLSTIGETMLLRIFPGFGTQELIVLLLLLIAAMLFRQFFLKKK
jgi:hypothetical protein